MATEAKMDTLLQEIRKLSEQAKAAESKPEERDTAQPSSPAISGAAASKEPAAKIQHHCCACPETKTTPLRLYSGRLDEEAAVFIRRLGDQLAERVIEVPEDVDDAVRPHFTGEASAWLRRNEGGFHSLEDFKKRFHREFQGPQRQEALREACLVRQQPNEDPVTYVTRIMRLRHRHDPQGNELIQVERTIGQMTHEYCVQLTQSNPRTFEELRTASEKWATVFSNFKPVPAPRRTTPAKKVVSNTTSEKSNPRCWFCPERHLNRDCPHRPADYVARHPASATKSGEESRAAPTH